jgi:anti-anti-sigma regulatory factor
MAGIEVQTEVVGGRVILRVQGQVDGPAAHLLHRLVCQVEPDAEVVLDFSRVNDFQDVCVGLLSRTLAVRPLELVGLRTHQARMFEYFGVSTRGPARAYYTPEELLVA